MEDAIAHGVAGDTTMRDMVVQYEQRIEMLERVNDDLRDNLATEVCLHARTMPCIRCMYIKSYTRTDMQCDCMCMQASVLVLRVQLQSSVAAICTLVLLMYTHCVASIMGDAQTSSRLQVARYEEALHDQVSQFTAKLCEHQDATRQGSVAHGQHLTRPYLSV